MTVSLVGLPGSGKTTLCPPLAMDLGLQAFVLGDALRNRSLTDSELRVSLSRGELAPESVVLDLIREAVEAASSTGIVVDGFPRHKGQIEFATRNFCSWTVLWLDCDVDTAASRLIERRVCGTCGAVRLANEETTCRQCGASVWMARAEDEPAIVAERLVAFRALLEAMLNELPRSIVHRIDSSQSASAVKDNAVALLRDLR